MPQSKRTAKIQDAAKLRRLYERYRQDLYRRAWRVVGDADLAEDLVQETFVKIIPHLSRIEEEPPARARAFLLLIVERLALDSLRSRQRRAECSLEDLEAQGYQAEAVSCSSEAADSFLIALKRLPIEEAQLLILRYGYGFEAGELAPILNLRADALRQRLHRIKLKLEKIMAELEG